MRQMLRFPGYELRFRKLELRRV